MTDRSVGNVGRVTTATIAGQLLSYELDGSGDRGVAVLLHANPGDARDYDAVVDRFRSAGFRVLRLDWPGYGGSPAPEGAASAVGFAGLLEDFLLAVLPEDAGQVVLVGNSLGGFAALRFALRRPGRVDALVLVAPGGFTAQNPLTRAVCRVMGSARWSRRLVGPLASAYTARRTPTSSAALARAKAVPGEEDRLRVYRELWASFTDPEHDLRQAGAALTVPVLLTWGRFDPVLPWLTDGRRARRSLPGARAVVLPSGHEPHAEVPEQWWRAVEAFLDEVVPGSTESARAETG